MFLASSLFYLVLAMAGTGIKIMHIPLGGAILKTLPAVFLAAWGAISARHRFGPWIALAALLGAAGDYSLTDHGRAWFLAGLCAFLVGHLAYSVAFARDLCWTTIRGVVIAIVSAFMVAILAAACLRYARSSEAIMAAPVSIYVLVMGVMMALAVLHNSPTRFIAVGAVLFIVSDAHIAVNHIITGPAHRFLGVSGLATYYLAQYLLVAGAIKETRLTASHSPTNNNVPATGNSPAGAD